MNQYIANSITLIRILFIPLILSSVLFHHTQLAVLFFGIAAVTDGLDGYIARYLKQTSPFGAWLDPIADKLIVISLLILLVSYPNFQHFRIPAIIIVSREIIVSGLREWMATLGKQQTMRVSVLSKWKTAVQMVALLLCLISQGNYQPAYLLFAVDMVFYLATALTVLSLMQYLWEVFKAM